MALPYYSMLHQPLRNDPKNHLRHYYLYHAHAPPLWQSMSSTKTKYHITGPTTAYHPTRSKRPPHSDDYTTVLSSIPWNLLPQLPFLLTRQSNWNSSTRNSYDHDVLPTHKSPATKAIHDHFQTSSLKSYSKVSPYLTVASLLAYWPALTTKFRGWIRNWHIWSFSQHCSAPPRPATSDKNLLQPP